MTKVRNCGGYLLVYMFIFLTLSGCHYRVDEVDYKKPQSRAAILIGDPQIYSRASLINDRRRETEYLQQLLKNSDVNSTGSSYVKFTPQIIRDLKTVETLSANLGLKFGQTIGSTPSTAGLAQQIESAKLQAQLAVLQKQIEGIQNAAVPAVTIPSPELSTTNASAATQANASPTVSWPDISSLQSTIKSIQEQLKNLSSTSLSATAPANNYQELADPRDDFIDRQAYRRDIRAALSEAQLDNVHDRGGNALYRLQFQATVLPPDGKTKQWGAVKMTIEPPVLTEDDIRREYLNWLRYLSTMLSDTQYIEGTEKQNLNAYNYDRYINRLANIGHFNIVDIVEKKGSNEYYCLDHQSASYEQLKTKTYPSDPAVKTKTHEKYGIFAIPPDLFLQLGCEQYSHGDPLFNKKLDNDQLASIIDFIGKYRLSDIFKILSKRLNFSLNFINIPDTFKSAILNDPKSRTDCYYKSDQPCFKAAGGDATQPGYAWRAYSVLPRELVQRLGVTTESSQSLQTALTVAAQVSPTLAGGLDIGYLRQSNARAEALSRQPLVVGFAGTEPDNFDAKGYFGWLFGPQFAVKDEKRLSLQQMVRTYGVNADISIPGWWKYVKLDIHSAWVANWSDANVLNTKDDNSVKRTVVYKRVNLPITDGVYEALTNFIAAKDVGEQATRLYARSVVPNVVPACTSSVTFQIGGTNIWRADNIYLGGVKAKNVTVSPDMQGVAAEFDMAAVFGSMVKTDSTVQQIPLTVSAEQGAAALPVYIVGKRTTSNGATDCQSPFFLPTNSNMLPPTVVSSSPSEICLDAKGVPLVIQGFNLPTRCETVKVYSEFFGDKSKVICGDGTYLAINLERDNAKFKETDLPKKTTALNFTFDENKNLIVKIDIKDCKAKEPEKKTATLTTDNVKKSKDQKISLKMNIPDNYSDLIISVRPKTDTNDAVWSDSASIKGVKSGKAAEVSATMNLSDISASTGDKLEVKVRLRPNPDKDWIEYSCDNTLTVAGS
jgi:hypothetical protein